MSHKKQIEQLIEYFRGDGYSAFGFYGDESGKTPVETAIEAMRDLAKIRGTSFYIAWQYSQLVEQGLVPAREQQAKLEGIIKEFFDAIVPCPYTETYNLLDFLNERGYEICEKK